MSCQIAKPADKFVYRVGERPDKDAGCSGGLWHVARLRAGVGSFRSAFCSLWLGSNRDGESMPVPVPVNTFGWSQESPPARGGVPLVLEGLGALDLYHTCATCIVHITHRYYLGRYVDLIAIRG